MTTSPQCAPCADLWAKLQILRRQYGVNVAVLSREEAIVRSGRLGLPWVGHPVAWVRATNDPNRVIPIAIGTDHSVNLARNIYLAFKMMTGVRPDVGVRAMAKRSEEHTSELQSLIRISYAVFCLKKQTPTTTNIIHHHMITITQPQTRP